MTEIVDKPLVTFALFAYNQEKYIREAVEGAFSQTYEPLEIILSDDCSTDRTFEIMSEMVNTYTGPHKVILNKNTKNLNIGEHVNVIGAIATGCFIVLAAGDDISDGKRTIRIIEEWNRLGRKTALIYSDFVPINEESKPISLKNEGIYRGDFSLEKMAQGKLNILGATSAISSDVIKFFKPLSKNVIHEDRVLPFRVLLLGGEISLIDSELVKYRVDGGVSRQYVTNAYDYIHKYLNRIISRTLPDALQRLEDLNQVRTSDAQLKEMCRKTIREYEIIKEIVCSPNIISVRSLLDGLSLCNNKFHVISIYLKVRFIKLFNLYYKIKY